MKKYNDNLDPDVQITAEEEIAAFLFARYEMKEADATQAGKQILHKILLKFRPDLFGKST